MCFDFINEIIADHSMVRGTTSSLVNQTVMSHSSSFHKQQIEKRQWSELIAVTELGESAYEQTFTLFKLNRLY